MENTIEGAHMMIISYQFQVGYTNSYPSANSKKQLNSQKRDVLNVPTQHDRRKIPGFQVTTIVAHKVVIRALPEEGQWKVHMIVPQWGPQNTWWEGFKEYRDNPHSTPCNHLQKDIGA